MAHEHLTENVKKLANSGHKMMRMEGMGEMMEKMMEMHPSMMGMRPMMMGNPANPVKPAAVTIVAAASNPGRSLLHRLARNPWVWFGLGVAAGILIHRYRKEILATAVKVGEKGKDFVLQQKESLEDLIAETQEKRPNP